MPKVLPKILNVSKKKILGSYPDLTSGVAGYLKTGTDEDRQYFHSFCRNMVDKLAQEGIGYDELDFDWGIPWIDQSQIPKKRSHPRLLNVGWLEDDLEYPDGADEELIALYNQELRQLIDDHYPNNNPGDWYVLADP